MGKQSESSLSILGKHQDKEKLMPEDINCALASFKKFQIEVDQEFDAWTYHANGSISQRDKLLNGGANTAAFYLIDERVRKAYGIFFSGHELANKVAEKISPFIQQGASVIDPACGAGDLLVACARHYPLQVDYDSTLKLWGEKLGGIDLHEAFITTISSRLRLLATETHLPNSEQINNQASPFQKIIVGDAFQASDAIREFDHIVTNPPYGYVVAPDDIEWANGKTQLAAIFIDRLLRLAKPGQNIVAVLPDVLRSGSRYARWRKWIAKKARILSIEIIGKFDENTDVDVFVLHLESMESLNEEWPQEIEEIFDSETFVKVGDICNVRIGPVVPHRDDEIGDEELYVDSSKTSGLSELEPTEKRKFTATKYKGPFVVLNRTSSPDDPNRMVCAVINTEELVLVENHLVILQPKDGKLETCKKIAQALKAPHVKNWVNARIRCRHLTTAVIKDIPLSLDGY